MRFTTYLIKCKKALLGGFQRKHIFLGLPRYRVKSAENPEGAYVTSRVLPLVSAKYISAHPPPLAQGTALGICPESPQPIALPHLDPSTCSAMTLNEAAPSLDWGKGVALKQLQII